MTDPQAPARAANLIGWKHHIYCRYEWDRKKQTFAYHFYRRTPAGATFLGSTTDPQKVVARMEKYASTTQGE